METTTRNVDIMVFARFLGLSMLDRGYSVSPLKLQKLLYYQQAWHMVIFGPQATLFRQAPEAWVNGPVYPEVYREYRGKVKGMCDHLDASHFGCGGGGAGTAMRELYGSLDLTAEETDLFYNVMDIYASKSQNQLILTTHSERPWIEARGDLLPFEPSNEPISLTTMHGYYKERYDRNRRGRA